MVVNILYSSSENALSENQLNVLRTDVMTRGHGRTSRSANRRHRVMCSELRTVEEFDDSFLRSIDAVL